MSEEELQKKCFVIAPIGEEESDTRLRSDQILRNIINQVVPDLGYEDAVRADQTGVPGMITTEIIQHLLDDELVIADLTDHNANVFYELAVRDAVRKPVVLLIEKGEKIPFDVSGMRVIQVNLSDSDNVTACKEELKQHIEAAEQDPQSLISPITTAIAVQALHSSDNPLGQSVAEIHTRLDELPAVMRQLFREIGASQQSNVALRTEELTQTLRQVIPVLHEAVMLLDMPEEDFEHRRVAHALIILKDTVHILLRTAERTDISTAGLSSSSSLSG